jgi:prepilin-type N-terminal cleavage/methylation domain-containing protein
MKKGFTLLELLIVIIIVGIMATLGLTQYTSVVERSRGAEARQVLGQLRKVCAALYMDGNNVSMCNDSNLGLGTGANGTIPSSTCAVSHFFKYTTTGITYPNSITLRGTRCLSSEQGKTPGLSGSTVKTVDLICNFDAGTGNWSSPNGY